MHRNSGLPYSEGLVPSSPTASSVSPNKPNGDLNTRHLAEILIMVCFPDETDDFLQKKLKNATEFHF